MAPLSPMGAPRDLWPTSPAKGGTTPRTGMPLGFSKAAMGQEQMSSSRERSETPTPRGKARRSVAGMQPPTEPHLPPRCGKSIFLHQGEKPMVVASERKGRVLSDAMERIARGESGYDPRGLVPGIYDPPFSPLSASQRSIRGFGMEETTPRVSMIPDGDGHYTPRISMRAIRVENWRGDINPGHNSSRKSRSVSFQDEHGEDDHDPKVLAELSNTDPRILDVTALYSPISIRDEVTLDTQYNGPPRSAKSVFVAGSSKPMVPAKQRKPRMVSDARERIARGEPGYDKDGLAPQARQKPKIPVRTASQPPSTDRHFGAAYPRAGTERSLQYRGLHERAGAYKAPLPGRHSIWCPQQGWVFVQDEGDEEEEDEEEEAEEENEHDQEAYDEVEESLEGEAESEAWTDASQKFGESAAAPPRSGKSVFVTRKPMVWQTERKPHACSEALDRISKGMGGYDMKGTVSALRDDLKFSKWRPVNHKPDPAEHPPLYGEYPRNGTERSLQYASVNERQGAHKAPKAGRHSIWHPRHAEHPAHGRARSFTPPRRQDQHPEAWHVRATPPKSAREAEVQEISFGSTSPVKRQSIPGQRMDSERGPHCKVRAPVVESTGEPLRVGGAPPVIMEKRQSALEAF